MDSNIIPHMNDALVLMDFLTDSYTVGGIVSILALDSLFIMITKYNLDYPDFYRKLYSLFESNLLHVKYRGRFLKLADKFLASTHLPAYLVAAFIKRIARLTLSGPPGGILLAIPFIFNSLLRHPACRVLIDKPINKKNINNPTITDDIESSENNNLSKQNTEQFKEEAKSEAEDCFKLNEKDPEKSGAIHSSLWELQTLLHHYDPAVARMAKIFSGSFEKTKAKVYELQGFADLTFQTLFEQEIARIPKEDVPLEYHMKKRLFEKGDNFSSWSFENKPQEK